MTPDATAPPGEFTVPAHGNATGAGPVTLAATDPGGLPAALPAGLSPLLSYWLIRDDVDTLRLARSRADAHAGIAVTFTDAGDRTVTLAAVDHPRDVDVSHNRLHSHTAAGADNCTVLLTNGQDGAVTGNEVRSYFPGTVKHGIRCIASELIGVRTDDTLDKFGSPAKPRELVADWTVSGNRIRGDAGGGSYVNGVTLAPDGLAIRGITVSGNTFRGCTAQVFWEIGGGGSYGDIPTATGNSGDGTDFAGAVNVGAVRIGGSADSPADYVQLVDGPPDFDAVNGSTARRRTGSADETVYLREDEAWHAIATQQVRDVASLLGERGEPRASAYSPTEHGWMHRLAGWLGPDGAPSASPRPARRRWAARMPGGRTRRSGWAT